MKQPLWVIVIFFLLTACKQANKEPVSTPIPIQSGTVFLTEDTQNLQADPFENPGYLWVETGKKLFKSEGCIKCHTHESPINQSAANYPKIDTKSGKLINLEGRINMCRLRYQHKTPLTYESDMLLSMTAYLANLAKDVPIAVSNNGAAQPHYQAGKQYYFQRRGQFNLSCAQCHNDHWGQQLRGDIISQGHGNGFPAYRFEWETLGSLHRRFSDCDLGVRAQPRALGSQDYIDLELYLAVRSQGLPVETPAIRR